MNAALIEHISRHHGNLRQLYDRWEYGNKYEDYFTIEERHGLIEIVRYSRHINVYYMKFSEKTPLFLISQVINFLVESIN